VHFSAAKNQAFCARVLQVNFAAQCTRLPYQDDRLPRPHTHDIYLGRLLLRHFDPS
jgi:hypothetical protein